jgi:DNA-binding transcriptional LysR family regulator
MELRYLEQFVTVAEELNFTRAAARLNVTQPPLSVQIRKLEQMMGVQLFERDNRNVELTEAGRLFLDRARQLLRLADQSVEMAQRAARGEIGHISVAYTNPAGFLVFPHVIPMFTKMRPDVHLTFHDLRIPQQIEKLGRKELDIGFVWLPIPAEEFDIHVLATQRFIAILPSDYQDASPRAIGVRELSGKPMVLIRRALDPESFGQIEKLFKTSKSRLSVAYELETLPSVLGFVAMGCGCSILPEYVKGLSREGVIYRDLKSPNTIKQLAVVKRKDASPLVRDFYNLICESFRPQVQRQSK